MSTALPYLELLAALTLGLPLAACGLLGLWTLLFGPPPERTKATVVALTFSASLASSLALAGGMAAAGVQRIELHLGAWFGVPGHAFPIELLVDRLTVPFMVLTTALLGLVGWFSVRYLHRESGSTRFFFLLLLFALGMLVLTMAGSLDLLFVGWELVGVTSALLIGFFQYRRGPVDNALWTFSIYRVCDVGLLAAAILLHHVTDDVAFQAVFGGATWPDGALQVEGAATALALLLVFAALGKSAQVPFSGWLPRAMEGPTPSSAIFYGALSIHAGAYLLLRVGPLLDASPAASWTLVALGVASALHGTFVGRVQSDVKSTLAYASVTQVGLILAEIGLGFRMLPLAHLCGHACLRTLQLLRAPSLLHEHRQLEQRFGGGLPPLGVYYEQLIPAAVRRWLYQLALERGYHDTLLKGLVVAPVLALARLADAYERLVPRLLGAPRRDPDPGEPRP